MKTMKRYAVYFAPRPGDFATRAAEWLGWDVATGKSVVQPELPGLPGPAADLTKDPRKYGFHGTIRAPFRLAPGISPADLETAVSELSETLPRVECAGLRLEKIHGFLALTPIGCEAALLELGARVVETTNPLRATLTPEEIAKRRPERLTARQRQLLETWGYPGVMEEFRFHLTLTSRLPDDLAATVFSVLDSHFAPVLPKPFLIEDLCLFGEDDEGRFHLLNRYALTG